MDETSSHKVLVLPKLALKSSAENVCAEDFKEKAAIKIKAAINFFIS